jgi:hypothetical protein
MYMSSHVDIIQNDENVKKHKKALKHVNRQLVRILS